MAAQRLFLITTHIFTAALSSALVLGVAAWGFSMVVPYWFSGGPDECDTVLFFTAIICLGIPVVVVSGMFLHFVGATVRRKACRGGEEEGKGGMSRWWRQSGCRRRSGEERVRRRQSR